MLNVSMKRCQWFAGAMIAIVLACPAAAQVVVIANGSPITEYDIQQRMKLEAKRHAQNRDRVNRLSMI